MRRARRSGQHRDVRGLHGALEPSGRRGRPRLAGAPAGTDVAGCRLRHGGADRGHPRDGRPARDPRRRSVRRFRRHRHWADTDPRVRFAVGDACALPVPSDAYDVVVAGLVLHFVPDPQPAVREMARAARRGGTVAAYVWDFAGEWQFTGYFWQAATALDPAAAAQDPGRQFPLCHPEPLAALFAGAGLQAVTVEAVVVPIVFRDFDDYWQPHLLGGSSPAQRYVDVAGRGAADGAARTAASDAADGRRRVDSVARTRGRSAARRKPSGCPFTLQGPSSKTSIYGTSRGLDVLIGPKEVRRVVVRLDSCQARIVRSIRLTHARLLLRRRVHSRTRRAR